MRGHSKQKPLDKGPLRSPYDSFTMFRFSQTFTYSYTLYRVNQSCCLADFFLILCFVTENENVLFLIGHAQLRPSCFRPFGA